MVWFDTEEIGKQISERCAPGVGCWRLLSCLNDKRPGSGPSEVGFAQRDEVCLWCLHEGM
jgi:hypothetical protein